MESAFQLSLTHRPVASKAPAVLPQLPAPAGRQAQPSPGQRQPPALSPRVPRLRVPELRRSRRFRAGRSEAASPGAPAAPASGREEGQEEGGSREPSPKPGTKPRGLRAVTCSPRWLGGGAWLEGFLGCAPLQSPPASLCFGKLIPRVRDSESSPIHYSPDSPRCSEYSQQSGIPRTLLLPTEL